jgi:hypothetical protein
VYTLARVAAEFSARVMQRAADVPADLLLAACTCCKHILGLVKSIFNELLQGQVSGHSHTRAALHVMFEWILLMQCAA